MRWRPLLSLVAAFGIVTAAVAETQQQSQEPALAVMGAAAGQITILAPTALFTASLSIESLSAQPVDAIVRVSPFRDSKGRAHNARTTITPGQPPGSAQPAGASLPASATEHRIQIPPLGSSPISISAELPAEGDYTSELILIAGNARSVVTITATRAATAMGVEILGLEPSQGHAGPFGESSASVRLTLVEQLGRTVELTTPQLIEHVRKQGDVRSMATFRVVPNQPAARLVLNPNSTLDLTLPIAGFDGAGEYLGKLRFSAPGMQPTDAAFTVSLREPAWVAFGFIFLGVALSVGLRSLGQDVRPRLRERRRAYQLLLSLDALLSQSGRDREEIGMLETLRRQCEKLLDDTRRSAIDALTNSLNRLEARCELAGAWLPWRRRVLDLAPPELREQFRATIEQVRAVILEEGSTPENVSTAAAELRGLAGKIDEALDEALKKRIQAIRSGIDAFATRPSSKIAVRSQADVRPLLEDADTMRSTNLHEALRIYMQARELWAALLLSDLTELLTSSLPLDIDAAKKTTLIEPLAAEARYATERLASDVDTGIRQYESILARYLAGLSDLLLPELDAIREKITAAKQSGRQSAALDAAPADLDSAASAIGEARQANLEGKRQQAVTQLWNAMHSAAKARAASLPATRGAALLGAETIAEAPTIEAAPGAIADPRREQIASSALRRPVSEQTLTGLDRLLEAIDLVSTVIAILIASVIGITTLWSTDPTWGGWQDWLVAVLWGLGLHQFTFAGVSTLRDRLVGNEATGMKP